MNKLKIKIITDREARVLSLRAGVRGKKHTLKEIADLPEFNLSIERIRQIEKKAMLKLWRRHIEIIDTEAILKELEKRGYTVLRDKPQKKQKEKP